MHIFKEIGPLKAYLKHHRSAQTSVGLIPTMGALHKGHISLVEASKRDNTITVCSIYVNSTQFNIPADLEKYPRTLEKDIQMLKDAGCQVAFCPNDLEMYPEAHKLNFDFGPLDKILEGEFRPGHFSAVALVVCKFFNIVQPDCAYFGQKDFQQVRIISRLAAELKFDLTVISAPIVREADGIAMSSRNMRLSPDERSRAVVLFQSLNLTRDGLLQGESFSSLKERVKERCIQSNVKLEYLALAETKNLTPLENVMEPTQTILLIAAYVGEVRLIDNLLLIENENYNKTPAG